MKYLTKAGLLAFVLIVGFILTAGCAQTGLSLTGTVERSYYFSPIGSASGIEYYVDVTATNTGNPVTFDYVRIIFDGGNNKGLVSTTKFMPDGTGYKPLTLNMGQAKELHSSTNGYTYDILSNSKAGKVALHVEFVRNEKVIDAFHAALPPLFKSEGGYSEMKYGEKVPLKFTRDYDAVMKEVRS